MTRKRVKYPSTHFSRSEGRNQRRHLRKETQTPGPKAWRRVKMRQKMGPLTLGVDLGGTKVETALVDAEGHILASSRYPTESEKGPAGVIADIKASVKVCLSEASGKVVALGIGVAGQVDRMAGAVRFAPNLGGRDVPLGSELEKGPVVVTNDVRAATWGEWCPCRWTRSKRSGLSIRRHGYRRRGDQRWKIFGRDQQLRRRVGSHDPCRWRQDMPMPQLWLPRGLCRRLGHCRTGSGSSATQPGSRSIPGVIGRGS